MSASAYDCYTFCQFKYLLSTVLGIEDISGPSAALGKAAHSVLEEISKAKIAKQEMPDYKTLWQKEVSNILCKVEASKIKQIQKGLFDFIENSVYTPYKANTTAVEKYFRIKLEVKDAVFNIAGLVDRIDVIDDKTIEILDYKTGQRKTFMSNEKEKKDSISLYDDIQPRLYYLAAKTLYPSFENLLVTMIYLTDGGPFTVPLDKSSIEPTKELLYKRFLEIKENNDPQKNVGWWCQKMCSYGKSGVCNEIYNSLQENGLDFVTLRYKEERKPR